MHAEALVEPTLERLAGKQDPEALEQRLDQRLQQLELRLALRFGAMLTAGVAITAAPVRSF